jgi:hypothetical protein
VVAHKRRWVRSNPAASGTYDTVRRTPLVRITAKSRALSENIEDRRDGMDLDMVDI